LESFFCGGNRLLNVTGLQAGLEGFYGSGQTATVPVSPDQLNPGSYLSDAAYSFGTHAITLDGTTAGFDAVAGRFATTSLDTPIGFETDDGTGQKVTGTVTFTLSPPQVSDSKDITSFVLAGKVGTISGTAITVTLPYGTGVGALTPEVAHTGASISPTGPQDFASPVAYTVTAEDETTRVYTVTVTVDTSVPVISAPDTWAGEGDAVARLDASYEDFVRLVLDGREVGPSNYTAGAGSTVITLHEGYLATLADGDYTFTAVFTNGTADIPVKVGTQASGGGGTGGGGSTTDGSGGGGSTTGGGSGGDAGTLPATGDAASLGLLALAVLLAAAGAGLVARRGQPQRGSIYRSGTRQGR
jgi:LPXTG-motif cell wall-anchored protein